MEAEASGNLRGILLYVFINQTQIWSENQLIVENKIMV